MAILMLIYAAISLPPEPMIRGTIEFRPAASEVTVPELFRLRAAQFDYHLEPTLETARYSVARLRFPSPIETTEVVNNTVHAEYFQPKGEGAHPAVVVLHILGADFALSRYMAARLADRGVAALFLKLPYYGERRPASFVRDPKRIRAEDIERSVTAMRQGVCDVRRAAIWLSKRPEVDPRRLGATGISLGGIVSSIVVAVDPEIRQGAFLLAGGDLASILWTMPEARNFRARWVESGRTLDELRTLSRPYDPLTYASGLRGKRVFMMAGNVDEVIPPASARALWEAAGRPSIQWYDCGHYSAAGFLLPGIRQTVDFFAGPWPQGG